MNAIQRFFARIVLNRIRAYLSTLGPKEIGELAVKLNKKVNLPRLSEATEYTAIYGVITTAVDVSKELIDLVKI